MWSVELDLRAKRDEFIAKLKEEWACLWRERFDDKTRGEGVSIRDYEFVFMSYGDIIFASRGAKTASFSEVVEYWGSQGFVYSPDPAVGGWGKFIRTELNRQAHSRAIEFKKSHGEKSKYDWQLKKGGKGWLHVE
jgi:hypothetical protein